MNDDIYRRVASRMWGDEKFRSLTPLIPSGQALWLVLLTGEQTGIVPGVARIGESAFAEQLGWPLKAFREAFAEVSAKGMVKADWEARFVWVPNAIRHNQPANPNVIKHWKITWSLLPECSLKTEAWRVLKAFVEGFGEAWSKAFAEACPEASPKQEAVSSNSKQEATTAKDTSVAVEKPPAPVEPLSAFLSYIQQEFPKAKADPAIEKAWIDSCPAIDLLSEAKAAKAWCLANPKKAPQSDFRRFLNTWFSFAHEKQRKGLPPTPIRPVTRDLRFGNVPAATMDQCKALPQGQNKM